ncbi:MULTISPECIES: MvaI/BcnI family restriction endonuclease [unclassified Desulfovibrio]|uniref:MvaI/BcnI family restriction endonuclease n=1 Tax=unclassified Desulfovibrio TaxID=2593640 RepID=UPI0013EAE68D|nr:MULTISPECIES: MvaI/BcnI family restriction endonuclease [unclassified Desulfovibrio]
MSFCHQETKPWHMRCYNELEARNVHYLVSHAVQFSTIHITETGYTKSILDATHPVRTHLHACGIHDYDLQPQGVTGKKVLPACFLSECGMVQTQASLYRPCTKNGDPRIWFHNLRKTGFALPNDILLIIVYGDTLYVINITKIDIHACCIAHSQNPIKEFLHSFIGVMNATSHELLGIIREKLSSWQRAEVVADTGVGRSVESLLGIHMNSSQAPDYKGIEIKTTRRPNLPGVLRSFAPDWDISRLKRGRDIVEEYGYVQPGYAAKTLQVRVTAIQPNRQGLVLAVNLAQGLLELNYSAPQRGIVPVVAWRLERLHARVLEKHHETFWLEMESRKEGGWEYFRCRKVLHTKSPVISQMDVLLAQGDIVIDLSLCRPDGHGDNYLFKIARRAWGLLFPRVSAYTIN